MWRWPTPHEVLGALVLVSWAATQIPGLAIPGSHLEAIAHLVMLIGAITGISSAAKFMPVHVQEVLAAHDEQVKAALAAVKPSEEVKS